MHKWTFIYFILRTWGVIIHNFFYRKIIVTNRNNIPKHEPVIFASNHQNGFLDPLAIGCTIGIGRQIVFLARGDIFKNPIVEWIFKRLKILPLFRQQDGANSLKKNEEVFNKSVEILKYGKSLALFPEGTHSDKRSLLPMKKVVSRIAFRAEESCDFQLGVKIVPVGIYYSHYSNLRSVLQINYGTPIKVSDYFEEFKNNEPQSLNALSKRLNQQIHDLSIDIRKLEFYDTYEFLRNFYDRKMIKILGMKVFNQRNKFKADKKIIEILDKYIEQNEDKFKDLAEEINKYSNDIKSLKLPEWVFEIDQMSYNRLLAEGLIMFLLSPIHLYGVIINYPAYKIPISIIKQKIDDTQFHGSFKFAILYLLFPIYYMSLTVVIMLIFGFSWPIFALLLSFPLTGLFSFDYLIRFRKMQIKFRYRNLIRNNKEKIIIIRDLRNKIIEQINDIVNLNNL